MSNLENDDWGDDVPSADKHALEIEGVGSVVSEESVVDIVLANANAENSSDVIPSGVLPDTLLYPVYMPYEEESKVLRVNENEELGLDSFSSELENKDKYAAGVDVSGKGVPGFGSLLSSSILGDSSSLALPVNNKNNNMGEVVGEDIPLGSVISVFPEIIVSSNNGRGEGKETVGLIEVKDSEGEELREDLTAGVEESEVLEERGEMVVFQKSRPAKLDQVERTDGLGIPGFSSLPVEKEILVLPDWGVDYIDSVVSGVAGDQSIYEEVAELEGVEFLDLGDNDWVPVSPESEGGYKILWFNESGIVLDDVLEEGSGAGEETGKGAGFKRVASRTEGEVRGTRVNTRFEGDGVAGASGKEIKAGIGEEERFGERVLSGESGIGQEVQGGLLAGEVLPAPRRGRGRPRKNPLKEGEEVRVKLPPLPDGQKRYRGKGRAKAEPAGLIPLVSEPTRDHLGPAYPLAPAYPTKRKKKPESKKSHLIGGIRLTERDHLILGFLARYRCATVGQLARMFDTSEPALRMRLPRLERAGLVTWAWAAQTKPKLWLITSSGLATVGMHLSVPTIRWGQLRHTLGLVDLGISFESSGEVVLTEREIRAAATRYMPTDRLKSSINFDDDPDVIRRQLIVPSAGRAMGHIPDMVLVRQSFANGLSGNISIELELTRKNYTEWKNILTAYKNSTVFHEVYYFVVSSEIKRGLNSVIKSVGAGDKIKVLQFKPVDLTADPYVTGGGGGIVD
jgi:hypothetical protein